MVHCGNYDDTGVRVQLKCSAVQTCAVSTTLNDIVKFISARSCLQQLHRLSVYDLDEPNSLNTVYERVSFEL